jgi:hypothetical protein
MFYKRIQFKSKPNFRPPSPTKIGSDIAWMATIIGCPEFGHRSAATLPKDLRFHCICTHPPLPPLLLFKNFPRKNIFFARSKPNLKQ